MIVGGVVRGFIFIGFIFWYSTGILRVINDYFRKEFNVYIKDELKNIKTLKYNTKTTSAEPKPFELKTFDNEQCHVNEIIQSIENDLIENSIASCTSGSGSDRSGINEIFENNINAENHKILIKNSDNSMRSYAHSTSSSRSSSTTNNNDDVMVDELHKVHQIFDIQTFDKTTTSNRNDMKSNDVDEIARGNNNNDDDVDNRNENGNWREMKPIHVNNNRAKVLHYNWYGNIFGIRNSNDKCIDMEMKQNIKC